MKIAISKKHKMRASGIAIIIPLLILILMLPNIAADTLPHKKKPKDLPTGTPIIWQDPGNIAALDLYHGHSEESTDPQCPCKFIKEDSKGANPKFVMEDAQGVKWKVKLGVEARTEVASVRLLSAIGYFTDDTYFMPTLKVEGLKLKRGREFIKKGIVFNARLEPSEKAKTDDWSWFQNPFMGTKELNGLKVMMALLNNWDIKASNNSINYYAKNGQLRYLVSDLGATLGRTGSLGRRTKSEPKQYAKARFVKHHNLKKIDFVMSNTPTPLLWPIYPFAYPFLTGLMKRKQIVENIPIEDVRWVTQLLKQLSDKQLADAFLGAGFDAVEVKYYAEAVRKRIDLLIHLTQDTSG